MKRHGFKSHYLYRVKVGGQITKFPQGTTEKYAREFARYAVRVGAMEASLERSLVAGGHETRFMVLATIKRTRRGRAVSSDASKI